VFQDARTQSPDEETVLVAVSDGETVASPVRSPDSLNTIVQRGELRYTLAEPLGQGGWGTVYKSIHHATRRMVAVKILRTDVAEDEEARKRFHREVEAISRLRHPNTVTLFDFGEDDQGRLFMAMEYVQGQRLDQLVQDEGSLAPIRALRIARQMAQSLEEAHGQGIVHRDIKPANTILTSFGDDHDVVKILDFGVARFVSEEKGITKAGTTFGTPEYMSPEQVMSHAVDHRSDLYSLGIVLYEMLAGRPPFQSGSPVTLALAQARSDPPPIESPYDIPRCVRQVLMHLLAKVPTDRYSSARDVINDLDAALTELESRPAKDPGSVRRHRLHRFSLRPWLVVVGAATISGAVLSAMLLVGRYRVPAEQEAQPAKAVEAALNSPQNMAVSAAPVPDASRGLVADAVTHSPALPNPPPRGPEISKAVASTGISDVEAPRELSIIMVPDVHRVPEARQGGRPDAEGHPEPTELPGPAGTDPVPDGADPLPSRKDPVPGGADPLPGGAGSAVVLPANPVRLRVQSDPSDVEVRAGRKVLCRTPCVLIRDQGDQVDVQLHKAGHLTYDHVLVFDRSRAENVTLTALPLSTRDGLKDRGGAESSKDGLK
jgi:serine/threonine protein kinase